MIRCCLCLRSIYFRARIAYARVRQTSHFQYILRSTDVCVGWSE